MKTTLNKIRKHSPCSSGWTTLLTNLGKTKADDTIIAGHILKDPQRIMWDSYSQKWADAELKETT